MARIDFEAHYITKDYIKALEENRGYPRYSVDGKTGYRRLQHTKDVGEPLGDGLLSRLLDTGSQRLESMHAAGIDMQVLSLTSPGVEQFDPVVGTVLARKCNDQLAEVVRRHPDRFLGFASLAPNDPEGAAVELERAVKDLGLKGWKTHSNFGDTYLDEPKYWPILERAEQLDVPIYLHPTVPAIAPLRKYGLALAGASFGFGLETSMCMMRLVFSGVFDRYPRLRIMLGHLGEGLPFLLQRIDYACTRPKSGPDEAPDLMRKPSEYLRENLFVTTSGNYLPAAFMCTWQALGIDRILLATDYPYEDSNECVRFIEELPITSRDRAKIYYENASQFGIPTEPAAEPSSSTEPAGLDA